MTAAEFKKKWSRYQGKETSAYQGHFDDLCRLLGQQTPAEADPSGADFFCFQKRVVKDAELFDLEVPDSTEPTERGFADVWKKNCFAWEYKGKKKNLDEAYKQLLRYRESLLNPPLLVVCDFDRYIIKTNFNGTVQEVHEFTNEEIDRPENLRILRALFCDPDFLKPQRTTAEVTEVLAKKIAEVARLLQKRESVEIADAKTRKELNFASRKNLRIARFLNRIVFCLFAEDTQLLPPKLFTQILSTAADDPAHFARTLETLFQAMAKGGAFGVHKIRHFNGHLFEEATVFELDEAELKILVEASEADWQFIEPSIMGTLFERALDESQRAQLGAHYTSETDIRTLVEPVLMSPLRREWSALKGEITPAIKKGKGSKEQREKLTAFLKKLSSITVLDPACGSGNFLYVALQLLLDLEKEVITFAMFVGFDFKPQVNVQQLKAIEINPYAYELAQVSVQIGFLQWRRDNGFDNDRTPVLRVLDGFENKDALMHETFKKKAKNLKAAREEEHQSQDNLFKVFVERAWPECDVIVGNPPFLGASKLKEELGEEYQTELWKIYGKRVAGNADLCCYWFAKAGELIADGKCKRAGLLATQGIRGGASREVLEQIKSSGDIFFAVSDEPWILAGADVRVSMVGFDDGTEKERTLDGKIVPTINANLTSATDVTEAKLLKANHRICFQGSQKIGPFEISEQLAIDWLNIPNAHGQPNSDVLKRSWNGLDLARRSRDLWMIDFGTEMPVEAAALYEKPYQHALELVKPERDKNNREAYRKYWWRHGEPRIAMRAATKSLTRYIATPEVTKHRIFAWLDGVILPDKKLMVVAKDDDYSFGVLHSHIHELWALAQCTWHGIGNDPRYTPTTCFETFPFPRRSPAQEAVIASAAKELNELRERWLNPPEWTTEKVLEFPGSITGPWSRYIDSKTGDAKTGIGTVRYPRLEPKDADCAAKLKKRTLTNLYNERPAWLDLEHKKLDAAVAAAYGFPADSTDEQILEKLLALNLERAAEEEKITKVKKPKTSREKMAEEMI